jgi:hypothetical protein
MSPPRNRLAELLASNYPPQRNALFPHYEPSRNALMDLWDHRSKTEWVSGHYKLVPYGLFGHRREWHPGYWRRSAW